MTDTLVRFDDGTLCWFASHTLNPADGAGPLPSRSEARERADHALLASLERIRAHHVKDWHGGGQEPSSARRSSVGRSTVRSTTSPRASRPRRVALDRSFRREQGRGTCIDRERASTSGPPGTSPSEVFYALVRADLPHGTQVAQTAHAALEALGHPPVVVVALAVPDEAALRRFAEALGGAALGHALIVEDAGPYAGQATALGLHPTTDRAAIRKVTSALPLVK